MSSSFVPQTITQITVEELAVYLGSNDPYLQLIDVREREEAAIAFLPSFELLPLSEFAQWHDEIKTRFNPEMETLVLCHHGVRSAQMCQWLLNIGFTKVKNISGGIDRYAIAIDPSIPRY
jgi:rhodanese-related sulfurtransferase